jgi:hypothetical protein
MRPGSKTILLSLVLAGVVYPQGLPRTATTERQGSIRGNVVMPDGSPVSGAVRVTLKVMRGDVTTAYTDEQGRFELNNLASGLYTLEVESDRDRRFEVSTERVQIARGGGPSLVTVFLKFKRDETAVTRDKTVSVVMLDQKYLRRQNESLIKQLSWPTRVEVTKPSMLLSELSQSTLTTSWPLMI